MVSVLQYILLEVVADTGANDLLKVTSKCRK